MCGKRGNRVPWVRRTGRIVDRSQSVIGPLTVAEASSVRRQLAGKEPVDEERLPVLLAIARQNNNFTHAALSSS
jgi:hypothetical protein